jgi:hypothetical protein
MCSSILGIDDDSYPDSGQIMCADQKHQLLKGNEKIALYKTRCEVQRDLG